MFSLADAVTLHHSPRGYLEACCFSWFNVASHDSLLKRITLRFLLDNWPDRCMFANILDFVKDSDKPIADMKMESRHDNTYFYHKPHFWWENVSATFSILHFLHCWGTKSILLGPQEAMSETSSKTSRQPIEHWCRGPSMCIVLSASWLLKLEYYFNFVCFKVWDSM